MIVWLTGLSGAGKTSIGHAVFDNLKSQGLAVEYLDGDIVREIFPQRGFSREARDAHIQQMGFLASRLEAHGVIVIAAFISPYRASRDFIRTLAQDFHEIHLATPLATCESRDVKGLYAKARRGEIKQFTGLDDPYEPPLYPELTLDTSQETLEQSVKHILDYLQNHLKAGTHGRA